MTALTKREYYAGQALPAVITKSSVVATMENGMGEPEFMAKASFEIADAMIAESEIPPGHK